MEKFRAFLEVVKKYHFWILCGLIVLIAFGSWYMSTSEAFAYFTARKGKIEGAFKSAASIGSNTNHPSDPYIKAIKLRESFEAADVSDQAVKLSGIDNASKCLASTVTIANTRLFEEQGKLNGLPPVYPDEANQARFEEAFKAVWNHKIEEIEKLPPLDVNYRNQYRDRIKDFFPKLFDLIDRRKEIKEDGAAAAPEPRGGRGFGQKMTDDRAKRYEGIVDWADAEKIMERFQKWNDTPTTLQVMLAQEDLWVYEALLRVIRNTNDFGNDPQHNDKNYKNPPSHKAARIKEILALEIGNEAVQSWTSSENSVIVLPTDNGATGPATGAPAPPPPMPMSMGRGQASYLQNSGPSVSPLAGRYVDNSGKPLADPTQQPNDEFRMMPIDMRLIIEQKDIPRLLAECANSNMRIDVRSVRLLVEKPGPFDLMNSNSQAPAGGGMGTPDMMGRAFGAHAMAGGRPSGGGDYSYSDESADPVNPPVPVEIQGIIYIYNPPENQGGGDNSQVGVPPAGTPPVGSAPSAPATPAPPVTPPAGQAPLPSGPAATVPSGAAPAKPMTATGSPITAPGNPAPAPATGVRP